MAERCGRRTGKRTAKQASMPVAEHELCQCGRRAYLDASRYSEGLEVPHCPRCEAPCTECDCEDKPA